MKKLDLIITFEIEDCFHLMGLQYLKDKQEARGKQRILKELLDNPIFRDSYLSSPFFSDMIIERIKCTKELARIIEDPNTVFRFINKKLPFASRIKADFVLSNPDFYGKEVYLFLCWRDLRAESSLVCKSVFPKTDLDYTQNQTKWQILLKEKNCDSNTEVLFRYKDYGLEPGQDLPSHLIPPD